MQKEKEKKIYLWFDPNGVLSNKTGGRIYNAAIIQTFGVNENVLIINDANDSSPSNKIKFLKNFLNKLVVSRIGSKFFIIDISNSVSSFFYVAISKILKYRIMVIVHHLNDNEISPNDFKSCIKKMCYLLLLNLANVVIAPSIFTKSQILSLKFSGGSKSIIRVLNPPIRSFESFALLPFDYNKKKNI